MAGLPERGSILERRGPLEPARALLSRDLFDRANLFLDHRLADPVELEEQRGRNRIGGLRIGVDDAQLGFVDDLDAGHRDAELDGLNDGVGRALHGGERADRCANDLGTSLQAQGDLGDHAERPFRSDEEACQVVTGRRLAGAPAGRDHAPVGQHHRQPQHVLPHRSVSHRGRAGRTGGGHSANRRVGAGIDREHQAGVLQVVVELEPGEAGFDRDVEIVGAEPEDAGHPRQVDRDAAVNRVDVPLERAAHAERHDRRAVLGAERDNRAHFVGVERENDRIGQPGGMPGFTVAMVLADGVGDRDSLAQKSLKLGDHGDIVRIPGFCRFCRFYRFRFYRFQRLHRSNHEPQPVEPAEPA